MRPHLSIRHMNVASNSGGRAVAGRRTHRLPKHDRVSIDAHQRRACRPFAAPLDRSRRRCPSSLDRICRPVALVRSQLHSRCRKPPVQIPSANDRPPLIQKYFDWPPVRDPAKNQQALLDHAAVGGNDIDVIRLNRMVLPDLRCACCAFVAVLRNHAEIVLTHPNRESPRSAALPFSQRSHSLGRCRNVFSLHGL